MAKTAAEADALSTAFMVMPVNAVRSFCEKHKDTSSLLVLSGQTMQTLGPGDQIQVRAMHAPELGERPVRVDSAGYIMLPLVGKVEATGRTAEQLAAAIRQQLSNIIRDPQVSVDIVEMKSQPVSVLGAVKTPGAYQIAGRKRLLEILSMAGGLDADAGNSIHITRDLKAIEISVSELIEGKRPELNVLIQPQDVITVPRGKLVYVIGEVRRPGGFVLRERENMSLLQALSMAEGLSPAAGPRKARILRQLEAGAERAEIPVNVKDVLAGKVPDQVLLANDILFIPNNTARSATMRGIEAAIQMGTGVAIWRF